MLHWQVIPYREKVAWLSIAAMLATFGPYFTLVATGYFPVTPMPDLRQLAGYAVTAAVQVTILIVGHIVLRRSNPLDAKVAADERDIAIKHRSVTTAYYVLITGMILVGVVMPSSSNGWHIVNSALFMIVLAELVQYSVMVIGYRRQAG